MDPNERCRCMHERKWHDTCSKCPCPAFFTGGSPAEVKLWKAMFKVAEAAAKRRGQVFDD